MNTGGPAFPSTMTDDTLHVPGMTLRDYFAAKALQGLVVSEAGLTFKAVAEDAYKYADAMLAERQKAYSEGEGGP